MLKDWLKKSNKPSQTFIFMRQFAAMLAVGIPITRCVDILEKSSVCANERVMLYKIKHQLSAGHPLFHCLKLEPDSFDEFTCQLVKLGETTGKLALVLTLIGDHHEKKNDLQRKIKHALFYPCFVFITAILLTFCVIIFVIPSFDAMFADHLSDLPLMTQLIFSFTRFFNHYLLLIAFITIASFTFVFLRYRQARFKTVLTQLAIKIPRIHASLLTLSLIRFSRCLSIALTAGLPILSALTLCADLCGHPLVSSAIHKSRASVSAGVTLHQAMSDQHIFPVLLQQMIKVGEESGTLDAMLAKTADILEAQLESEMRLLLQLLEPLIMIVQGVLIGGLVIGMYLPVFNLGSTL